MKFVVLFFFFLLFNLATFGQVGYTQKGYASYYSHPFHGKRTANGETFDMQANTAAHPTLAFGSMVKVTNLKSKKSVIVRINDRGPFWKNRIIDLSHKAAKSLNFIRQGKILVKLEVIDIQNKSKPKKVSFESFTIGKFYHSNGTEFTPDGFSIQIASFSDKNNALKTCKQLEAKGYKSVIKVIENNKTRMYRIFAGTYSTEKSASKVHKKLLKDYPKCFVFSFN